MNTRFSKSILVLAIVSLLGTGAALAGGNGNGNGDGSGVGVGGSNAGAQGDFGGGPAGRMARINERLNLSTDQQHDLLDLLDAQERERAQIHADIVNDYGDRVCTQRRLHQAEFQALLTPDQLALHEAMMAQRGERRANNGQRRGAGGFDCLAEDADDS